MNGEEAPAAERPSEPERRLAVAPEAEADWWEDLAWRPVQKGRHRLSHSVGAFCSVVIEVNTLKSIAEGLPMPSMVSLRELMRRVVQVQSATAEIMELASIPEFEDKRCAVVELLADAPGARSSSMTADVSRVGLPSSRTRS